MLIDIAVCVALEALDEREGRVVDRHLNLCQERIVVTQEVEEQFVLSLVLSVRSDDAYGNDLLGLLEGLRLNDDGLE